MSSIDSSAPVLIGLLGLRVEDEVFLNLDAISATFVLEGVGFTSIEGLIGIFLKVFALSLTIPVLYSLESSEDVVDIYI
jgi:hypothetical protein